MPIFQDPDRQRFYDLWSDDHHETTNDARQQSIPYCIRHHEGGARAEPCRQSDQFLEEGYSSDLNRSGLRARDREELIQYIKSADAHPWAQHGFFGDTSAGHYISTESNEHQHMKEKSPDRSFQNDPCQNNQELASPADIERPRSALHSGDFREGITQSQQLLLPQSPLPGHVTGSKIPHLSSSPTTPWFTVPAPPSQENTVPTSRSRAPSLGSFSSSYVLKAPTSPLVYQANNTDLDFSPRNEPPRQPEFSEKASRRRTLPPETFRHLQASPTAHRGAMNFQSGNSSGNWNESLSDQNQIPRRSMTSGYSLQLASSVQTLYPRARRPSITAEASSKPHAPMVGSYEESILRGRMSMNPSKPLDFTAQIGVLGKDKCKASLKCPPHVSIPFPAVFYSYPTSGRGRSISDDNPSPYVGMIDLDNALPKDTSSTSQRRRRHQSPAVPHNEQTAESVLASKPHDQDVLRRREKRHRRAESPKCPPGGCYRIPQQGQLQIMIKNPNKTAVKLFLVPYDLSDMEPGTKTFIRQRSYSAGPVIDMPLNARKNYGTDRPEASLNTSEDPKDKPILRYLVHLNICSPSRGRFYLHSSIRVVFANRVPDGKEQLRNEIQHPDPRYTPYKPVKDLSHMHPSAKSLMEREPQQPTVAQNSIAASYPVHPSTDRPDSSFAMPMPMPTSGNVNLENTRPIKRTSHIFQPIPSLREEEIFPLRDTESGESHRARERAYYKLSKGDAGYGGYSSIGGLDAGESLLAKRLRGLDVQKYDSPDIN